MKSLTPQSAVDKKSYLGTPKSVEASPKNKKAWNQAVDFESVFLNTMFGQMFAGVGDSGLMGGKHAESWRGMLVDEYSKSVAKQGGIGLAPQIYRELIGAQEAAPRKMPPQTKISALPPTQ